MRLFFTKVINLFFPKKPTVSYSFLPPERPERVEKAFDLILDIGDCGNNYLHFTAKSTHAHNLKALMKEVDEEYFASYFANTQMPRISWWWRNARAGANHSIGGAAFVCHNEILINVRFNSRNASRDIVKLLVYHEMLHIKLHIEGLNCNHTYEFYRRERLFENFHQVNSDLDEFFDSHVTGKPLKHTNFKKPKTLYSVKRFKVLYPSFH